MEIEFESEVIEWRGPAPYFFVPVPDDEAALIAELAPELTYGWGVIPVTGWCGEVEFTTSLFPRAGGYLVPLKVAVRRPLGLGEGDPVVLRLRLGRDG